MKKHLLGAFTVLFLSSLSAQADWAQSSDQRVVSPAPLGDQVQNPPTFQWAAHSSNPASYIVQVLQAGVVRQSYTTTRTWVLPTAALAAGSYTWRVRPSTSTTDWSSERAFAITAASTVFIVPSDSTLKYNITHRGRPRSLPLNFPKQANWTAAMSAERASYVTALANEVNYRITNLVEVNDAMWPLRVGSLQTADSTAQNTDIRTKINTTVRQIESSALLFRLTGNIKYFNEAVRRGDLFAALDGINGPTSYANQDQATRAITATLMRAIDILDGSLDSGRRSNWLAVVQARGHEIYQHLSADNNHLDQQPYDSHASTAMAYLALISSLAVGEFSEASTWFDFSFRAYVSSLSPWSGPEGGYANGTAYGEYTLDYDMQMWPGMNQATGVDLFKKHWSTGMLKFFTEFMPPGTKNHLFGDGHESAPEWKFMKAFASRLQQPQAAWYLNALDAAGVKEDALTLLQAPFPLPARSVTSIQAPPDAMMFPGIGWSAMHSNASDANRTSMYFKSSPYGSYNHSHADQNTFVLKKAGIPLITETGHIDYYGSDNWLNWYRPTKSHNGITFDGGIGQAVPVDSSSAALARDGKIIGFTTSTAMDTVIGNATSAYSPDLTKALRKIWYLRASDAFVIYDQLESATPHVYEWTFHAPVEFVRYGTGNANVQIANGGQKVCVIPIFNDTKNFERFAGPASLPGTVEAHARYLKMPATKTGEFLMVLDVGCKNLLLQFGSDANGRFLNVGSQQIRVKM